MEKKSFHMNISSLCHNFNGLETLLTRTNEQFNIIHVTEAKLRSYLRDIDISLNGNMIKHTPTEANCNRALLYTENSINYTVRGPLEIYKERNLIAFL